MLSCSLAQMSADGPTMTTILKTNQYTGLSSFTNVGSFVPLTVDRHGTVLREVAPAQFLLARPDRGDEPLMPAVALIRYFPRTVSCPPSQQSLPPPSSAAIPTH